MHISFLLSIFLFSLQVQANVLNITETAGHVKTFFGSDVPNHIKENLDKLKNKMKAHIYKTYPEIYGEGPTNVTTVVDTIFDGSLNKYKQSCQRLFDRLDANKNNVIDSSDMEKLNKEQNLDWSRINPNQDENQLREQLQSMDSNGDGYISFDEFWAKMQVFGQQSYTVDPAICQRAQNVLERCNLKSNASDVKLFVRVSIMRTLCHSGLPAIRNYPLETCLISKQNCDEAVKCYSTDFRKANIGGGTALQTLQKRDKAQIWQALFWVSLLTLFIFNGSLITLPLWALLGFIGYRVIDWNRLGNTTFLGIK